LAPDGYLALREHDLALLTWDITADPIEAMRLYDGALVPGDENGFKGKNYSGLRNERFDELLLLASQEWEHPKLVPLYAEMQAILADELPSIPLTSHPILEAYNRNLVGWDTGGTNVPSTYKLQALYFK
jgi:ABC-type transport system substrate-binding protein